jgi:eukaryotic-like serine/threonine-protein kinase
MRRHLRNEPVSARPDSVWYRARKFAARHTLEIGAAGAIAVALVAGTGIAVSQARRSGRERDRALEQLRRAEVTNDFSSLLFSEATPSGRPLSNAELLARGEAYIGSRFVNDPLLRVHLLLILSERYYENYQFDRWRTTVARAFEDSRGLPDTRLRALATCTMAIATAERGDFPRAYALAEGALGELAGEDAAAEAARCRLAESVTASMQGDGPRAIRAGEESLQLELGRRGPPGREIEALSALANAYSMADRFASADKTYRQLMAAFDAQGRGVTRNAATCLNNWAVSLEAAGQYGRAATVASQALALRRRLDTEHGAGPAELRTVGSILSVVGRHDEALAAVDEAVAKARPAGSPMQLFWALAIAARVHGEAGRLDSSATLLRELDALVNTQSDLPVRERAGRERILARDALLRQRPQDAVMLARRALVRLEEAKRPNRELLPVVLVLASALNAASEFAAARDAAERARAMSRARLGEFEHSHELGLASFELGIAEEGLQHREAGRNFLRAAVDNLQAATGDVAPASVLAAGRLARIAP